MGLKVVLMILMLLFSLGTMPAPMAATRVDVAELLAAIDIPTGKTGDSSWCDNCACTRSIPPYCRCQDASLCTKCVCSLTLSYLFPNLRHKCDCLASEFVNYCLVSPTNERIQAILT